MAYCLSEYVAAEFKGHPGFTSSTEPSSDDVLAFIKQSDAEIDGRLANKYVTPITGTTALLIVRQISVLLTKARVQSVISLKTGNAEADQGGDENGPAAQARKMLDSIVKGEILLADATLAVSGDGVRSYTYDEGIETDFDGESDSW